MDFQSAYQEKLLLVNEALAQVIHSNKKVPDTLQNAIGYSLLAGGKRLRPILLLAANELAGGDGRVCLPLAVSLEMIHTYSLIHDDLPAMDDDDYRRGKPTNHKIFGEAIAILAGDGLLNLAYEVMLKCALETPENMQAYLKAATIIAEAAGILGMIGGQTADIEQEGKSAEEGMLDYIHTHKTGALITASLCAGVVAQDCPQKMLQDVESYGKSLGLAFQITDDILDVTGDPEKLGKSSGSDSRKEKLTYPARYGLNASIKMAKMEIDQAVSSLASYGTHKGFLIDLARSIAKRQQ